MLRMHRLKQQLPNLSHPQDCDLVAFSGALEPRLSFIYVEVDVCSSLAVCFHRYFVITGRDGTTDPQVLLRTFLGSQRSQSCCMPSFCSCLIHWMARVSRVSRKNGLLQRQYLQVKVSILISPPCCIHYCGHNAVSVRETNISCDAVGGFAAALRENSQELNLGVVLKWIMLTLLKSKTSILMMRLLLMS